MTNNQGILQKATDLNIAAKNYKVDGDRDDDNDDA